MSNKFEKSGKSTFERLSKMTMEERRQRLIGKERLKAIVMDAGIGDAFASRYKENPIAKHFSGSWRQENKDTFFSHYLLQQSVANTGKCGDATGYEYPNSSALPAAESNDDGYAKVA